MYKDLQDVMVARLWSVHRVQASYDRMNKMFKISACWAYTVWHTVYGDLSVQSTLHLHPDHEQCPHYNPGFHPIKAAEPHKTADAFFR